MKHIAFFLLILILVAALLACGDTEPPRNPDTTTASPETAAPLPDLELVSGSVANYTIIRGDRADTGTVEAAALLRTYMEQYTGATPLSTDWVRKGEEPNHTTHVGQKFHILDAVIENLYTHESYFPRKLTDYNTCPLVLTVDVGGQRFFVTEDATNDVALILNSMYGHYLKSDLAQTANHGSSTGSSNASDIMAIYSRTAASVVLWPIGECTYAEKSARNYNAHLNNLPSTKEIFVAGSRIVSFPLPYTPGSSGCPSILK